MMTRYYHKLIRRFNIKQPVFITGSGGLVIQDYRTYLRGRSTKRALLCYLTGPIKNDFDGYKTVQFSNHGIALSWARGLNELGYIVDIVDWDNKEYKPTVEYDLVVFHGGVAFKSVWPSLKLHPNGHVIHFLTGTYWKYNNKAEEKRFKDFKKRHGIELPRDRHIDADEDKVSKVSDGIIVIGSEFQKATYPKVPKVIAINNATFPDTKYNMSKKDYEAAKNKFFFFAGGGNIHKGMDILVDAFNKLDAELYIVCSLDKPVIDALVDQLKSPNIHVIGRVGMRSQQYYELVNQCGYVILPSCSEGQPGSVLECMQHGLVPIVSQECGIPCDDFGYTLKKSTVNEVRDLIEELLRSDPAQLQNMSHRASRVVSELYSPRSFMINLKQAISEITYAKRR